MLSHIQRLLQKAPFASMERGRLLSYIQALIATTFLIAVGIISLTMIRYARSDAAGQLVDRGATVTSIIARAAAGALDQSSQANAQAALDRILYDIRAEEGLAFAFVLDRDRQAIAHSDNRKKGTTVPAGLPGSDEAETQASWVEDGFYYTSYSAGSSHSSAPAGATVYEFVRTVDLTGTARERYGPSLELHIGFSLPGFWPFARSSLKRSVPGLAIALLLLIVGNYLAGVLVKPLHTLKDETAVAAKAEDDWQLEVEAEASGEIAEIAGNWNKMVENFQSSYRCVVEARREMEVRNRVMLYEKKRTEAVVDSLTDGVMVTDAYGKISFVNRECESLLGVGRDGAVGRNPQDVLEDEQIVKFMETAQSTTGASGLGIGQQSAAGRKKKQRRSMDLEIERKNGTRHIRVSYVPVVDNTGKPGGAITVLRDVTQSKLEESARKEFISNVTHELRAPLTAIKSYVELLIDNEAKDPELQRDFFNTINEEADRLARLINDMLNMSKIEVGNLVLNKSLVRTRKLIEDAVNGVRSGAKSKSIELTANISADLPDVEADKEMVRVVVTNLLGNGIKYTQEGGEVVLSAELVKDSASPDKRGHIAVTVTDNGSGIPEDELDKIFEKFYRGRATAGQKVVGNGLGLALSREIATLHGGDIKVTSAVGQGSKFTFLLPAAETSRKVS